MKEGGDVLLNEKDYGILAELFFFMVSQEGCLCQASGDLREVGLKKGHTHISRIAVPSP